MGIMNNIMTLIMIISVLMMVSTFTIITAAGYRQVNSTMSTTTCKDDKPCRNTVVVCTNNHLCSTNVSNSTSWPIAESDFD